MEAASTTNSEIPGSRRYFRYIRDKKNVTTFTG